MFRKRFSSLWGTSRGGSSDPYYDLFEDWELIVSSFLSQYGLRIQTREFETVSWDEFRALLAGLAPDTALGRVVAIRSETDKNVLKHFTSDQRRIYDEWRESRAEKLGEEEFGSAMADLEKAFAAVCKAGGEGKLKR